MSEPNENGDSWEQVLSDQISYWEGQRQLAEEQRLRAERHLEACDRALTGLRETFRLRQEWDKEQEASAQTSEAPMADPVAQQERPRHKWLYGSWEVRQKVAELIPELDEVFTRPEVEDALFRKGFTLSTSTLRNVLLNMAGKGDLFTVREQGSGRMPTNFQKRAVEEEKGGNEEG
jgi:hypothetical protein